MSAQPKENKCKENQSKVKIQQIKTTVTLPDKPQPNFEVDTWLETKGEPYQWLLAHTYDGVIWGRRDGKNWQLSSNLIPNSPPLTIGSLLELRLFCPSAESYVWRNGTDFLAREIIDDKGSELAYYDEPQLLWGTKVKAIKNNFTRLKDGSQGLTHAIPLSANYLSGQDDELDLGVVRPASLTMRHYVEADVKTGLARVILSRLTNIELNTSVIKEKKNGTQA